MHRAGKQRGVNEMRKLLFAGAIGVAILSICSASFAQDFAVVNNNVPSPGPNTATMFGTGAGLPVITTLTATGQYGLGFGPYVFPAVAITKFPFCIFISNGGSSSISAFKGASPYTPAGSFSNAALFSGDGIGLAVTPNGQYLYGAYSGTVNIGAWKITNCKLTFVGAYPEFDDILSLAVTSDGKTLIVAETNNQIVDAFLINSNGTLTTGTSVVMASTVPCTTPNPACRPAGIDTTEVVGGASTVVIGNAVKAPYYLQLNLTAPGTFSPTFTNNPVCTTCTLTYTESPEFDPAAWSSGTGNIYFGASGTPSVGSTGIADCAVTLYSVSCPGTPPLQYACAACNAGNIAVATSTTSPNGIWQTVFQGATSYVDLPKVIFGVISPFRGRSNPSITGSPAYSIAAWPGRPLN
jgi:hypothetical protein